MCDTAQSSKTASKIRDKSKKHKKGYICCRAIKQLFDFFNPLQQFIHAKHFFWLLFVTHCKVVYFQENHGKQFRSVQRTFLKEVFKVFKRPLLISVVWKLLFREKSLYFSYFSQLSKREAQWVILQKFGSFFGSLKKWKRSKNGCKMSLKKAEKGWKRLRKVSEMYKSITKLLKKVQNLSNEQMKNV